MDSSFRRLRLALIGMSMLCAVLVLVVLGVLGYWHRYLLGPSDGAFSRGPYLVRLSEDSARLAWNVRGGKTVDLRAISPDGSEVVARGGATREATRSAGQWTVSGGGADQAWLAGELARTALQLTPVDFVAGEPSGLEPVARVTFTAATSSDLEFFTTPENDILIRTPLTQGLARIREASGRRLLEAIDQLLPPGR
jgi:hypothetical protein